MRKKVSRFKHQLLLPLEEDISSQIDKAKQDHATREVLDAFASKSSLDTLRIIHGVYPARNFSFPNLKDNQ